MFGHYSCNLIVVLSFLNRSALPVTIELRLVLTWVSVCRATATVTPMSVIRSLASASIVNSTPKVTTVSGVYRVTMATPPEV